MNGLPRIVATADGPKADPAGPDVLAQLLTWYETELVAAGVPLDKWLRPGIDRDEVTARLAEVGLVVNEELIVWFGWHNGRVRDEEVVNMSGRALPNLEPASLDEAIARYRALVLDFVPPTMAFEDAPLDAKYFTYGVGKGWLRLGSDNHGCAVNCSEAPHLTPKIRYAAEDYWYEENEEKYQAVSICTWITWSLENLRSGAYSWNSSEQLWNVKPELLQASQLAADFP